MTCAATKCEGHRDNRCLNEVCKPDIDMYYQMTEKTMMSMASGASAAAIDNNPNEIPNPLRVDMNAAANGQQ